VHSGYWLCALLSIKIKAEMVGLDEKDTEMDSNCGIDWTRFFVGVQIGFFEC